MKRSPLPQLLCPLPSKDVSVREHDYSIRLSRVAVLPKNKKNGQPPMYQTNKSTAYEITELCIEPIAANVVRVLAADGAATQMSTNIPLEEICHTDDMLEIKPIDDLPLDEAHTRTICLNEVCKVCLKDLTDSPHKIPFFDDFGQCSTEISKISAALELMNVEIPKDYNIPKQMCMECFNILSKMTLFRQICKRSQQALVNIGEFVAQQQSNMKVEEVDNLDTMYDASIDIFDIKEEPHDIPEPESLCQQLMEMGGSEEPESILPTISSSDHSFFKQHVCDRCGANFDHRNSVVFHKRYELCVNDVNPVCRFCNKTYLTVVDLDYHLKSVHTGYPCGKCDKIFPTLSKFNNHQRSHRILICDFCGQTFFSKRIIREHLQQHVFKTFACLFCSESFKTPKSLGMHKRLAHPDDMYKCPHCPKEFKVKDRYRVHLQKHNPDKKHKCTYCSSQFVLRHHLENHIRTHTKETPFLCDFCGKAFRGDVALRSHLSSHDSVKYPYRYRKTIQNCRLCNYTSSNGNLKAHMIREHSKGGGRGRVLKELEYSCHICEKAFRLEASLTNHLRIHDEVRDFHCTYCKQSFRKANYLRLHIDGVHLNKKPNKCDQCDAAYLMSNDLRRHKLQRHSEERPFQCVYCSKRFAVVSSLKAHVKGLHSGMMSVKE